MIDDAIAELTPVLGSKRAACTATGRPQANHYRRHRQSPTPVRPRRERKAQPRALSAAERDTVRSLLNSPDFVDKMVASTSAGMAVDCIAGNRSGLMMAIEHGCYAEVAIPDPAMSRTGRTMSRLSVRKKFTLIEKTPQTRKEITCRSRNPFSADNSIPCLRKSWPVTNASSAIGIRTNTIQFIIFPPNAQWVWRSILIR